MTEDRRKSALFFAALFAVTLALRLCHSGILWADEDYHLAAGIQTLHGKMLYRDLWYDKPPLSAWLYALMGALPGWPLRLFDALFVLAVCAAAWRFARDLWGRREAMLAAGLLAFFLNFDLASSVLPIVPDYFLLLPAIVALHSAWRGKPLLAGLCCGVAFLFHTKGLFILAACGLLAWRSLPLLMAGFAIPNVAVLAGLAAVGALPQYFRQVWEWGAAYAGSSPEVHPWANGLRRTADWLGFHAALVCAALLARKRENWWLAGWLALSFASAALGARFFPRYFLMLLPPLVLLASRGLSQARENKGAVALAIALLLIPLVRFGPRYLTLAADLLASRPHAWSDLTLDQDSRAAASLLNDRRQPADTLFVWGYRPAIFVYTRMPVASKFWDSQPLTGVPADRHLRDILAVLPQQAAANREEFAASTPTFVVDSLSLSNPRLAMQSYPDLQAWMTQYKLVAQTPLSLVYQRASASR